MNTFLLLATGKKCADETLFVLFSEVYAARELPFIWPLPVIALA
jgi:hypothetical protein